jgi:hypothetical protein
MINIRRIIKEEVDDFDWAKGETGNKIVKSDKDYWGWWRHSGSKLFNKLNIPSYEIEIKSSDYDGTIEIVLSIGNLKGEFYLSQNCTQIGGGEVKCDFYITKPYILTNEYNHYTTSLDHLENTGYLDSFKLMDVVIEKSILKTFQ